MLERYSVYGNVIQIIVPANTGEKALLLPPGYSFSEVYVQSSNAYVKFGSVNSIDTGTHYKFPVVNGKSPIIFRYGNNTLNDGWINFIVEKFGGEPDLHYFDKDFEPILVKRKDGTVYNLIPTRNKGGV